MPYVRHVRFWGVRQLHSTEEAGEQRQRLAVGGVCGGKGADQGELQQLRLDRTPCRASRSRGLPSVREAALIQVRFWSSSSKVGAVCGSSARTDLCGGPPARAVPTAITK